MKIFKSYSRDKQAPMFPQKSDLLFVQLHKSKNHFLGFFLTEETARNASLCVSFGNFLTHGRDCVVVVANLVF